MKNLDSLFNRQDEEDIRDNALYLRHETREPLLSALRRRASLIWQLLTRDRIYIDEDECFRETRTTWERVLPGHPDYDKGETRSGIYKVVLSESPWLKLVKPGTWPNGISEP